jgi:hypothetical protein
LRRIRWRTPAWMGAILRRRQHRHPPLQHGLANGGAPPLALILAPCPCGGNGKVPASLARLNAGCLRLPLCLTVAVPGDHPRSRTQRAQVAAATLRQLGD